MSPWSGHGSREWSCAEGYPEPYKALRTHILRTPRLYQERLLGCCEPKGKFQRASLGLRRVRLRAWASRVLAFWGL